MSHPLTPTTSQSRRQRFTRQLQPGGIRHYVYTRYVGNVAVSTSYRTTVTTQDHWGRAFLARELRRIRSELVKAQLELRSFLKAPA